MKPQKVRFTVWLDPATLEAAKVRSRQDGVSVSEALAEAATESLLRNRADPEAQIVKAVERVFHLVQRTDRRGGFDGQVLKEMVGLMVLSFFNHTPAVPEANKKAALLDGKVRFHRFLDTLAANLRTSKSILSDLPVESMGTVDEEGPRRGDTPAAAAESQPLATGRKREGDPPHRLQQKRAAAEAGNDKEPDPPGKAASPEQAKDASAEYRSAAAGTEPPSAESGCAPAKKRWGLFG